MAVGRVEITTVPVDAGMPVASATYLPSSRILLFYGDEAKREMKLTMMGVMMDDMGANPRPSTPAACPNDRRTTAYA